MGSITKHFAPNVDLLRIPPCCRFLLFSDVKKNRIWKWEEGNGLFTIGKSLFLGQSGCRTDADTCSRLIEPGMYSITYSAISAFSFFAIIGGRRGMQTIKC